MKIGAIVLAGGRSRRMGKPKESLPIGGTTMLCRTVETLIDWAHPVLVVARDEQQELPPLPIEIDTVFDGTPDQGPLVGMLAGMKTIEDQCEAVFVTGCDVPFLRGEAIDWLAGRLGDHDLVMARIDDTLQPLGALYRMSLLPTIEKLVADGVRTPRTLAEHGNPKILDAREVDAFDPKREFLHSVNTPEEYESAKAAVGE